MNLAAVDESLQGSRMHLEYGCGLVAIEQRLFNRRRKTISSRRVFWWLSVFWHRDSFQARVTCHVRTFEIPQPENNRPMKSGKSVMSGVHNSNLRCTAPGASVEVVWSIE
jgi:hypothetical protein